MKLAKIVVVLCLLCSTAFPQNPDPEIRAKYAEQQLKVERARVESARRTIASLQQEIALKTALYLKQKEESERQATATRAKIEELSAALATTRQNLVREKQITEALNYEIKILTKERDKARSWKISFLRVFGIKRR